MSVMAPKKQTKSNKAAFKEDIIAFIKNNITKPTEKTTIIVKPLWNRYFRVNFIKTEYRTKESLIANNTILDSKFIEVIDVGNTYKIIDKTTSGKEAI